MTVRQTMTDAPIVRASTAIASVGVFQNGRVHTAR